MSSGSERVRVERNGNVGRIVLDRSEARNALNETMIANLAGAFSTCEDDDSIRVIVLEGRGPAFCAGADIAWMRAEGDRTRAENLASARRLARLFEKIDTSTTPVIVAAQGAALGGGLGLVACGDIVIATEDCRFALPEVRLGIVPAVIAPFVVAKIGAGRARDLFLSARAFDGREAEAWGLVTRVVEAESLGKAIDRAVDEVLRAPPDALASAKDLVRACARRAAEELRGFTTGRIADARASESGQEGLRAFLEKRPPSWSESRKSDGDAT